MAVRMTAPEASSAIRWRMTVPHATTIADAKAKKMAMTLCNTRPTLPYSQAASGVTHLYTRHVSNHAGKR